jgi:hypothetical protein
MGKLVGFWEGFVGTEISADLRFWCKFFEESVCFLF